VFVLIVAAPAFAQTSSSGPSKLSSTVTFLVGGAAGLGIHESGHVLFGAMFGANPGIRGLHSHPIPFFVITHDEVTRRKEFVISSAGFWMQHLGSEWLLTERPNIAHEHAPFLKGIFAFNLGASAVYSVAAFARLGPPERDTRGMAISLGKDGVPEPWMGALILAPAVLDGYRYLRPDAVWAKWTSRGLKITAVLLTFAAGR
jgi:hypothetical protein